MSEQNSERYQEREEEYSYDKGRKEYENEESSTADEKAPATCKEIITRWGAGITFVVNAGVLLLRSVVDPIGKMDTLGKVGRGSLYVSGGTSLVMAPAAVYQERKLTEGKSFRSAMNLLREDANRLSMENDKLGMEIDELERSAQQLQDIEAALDELTVAQGANVNNLVSLVKENKAIAQEMRKVLKARALEEIVSLVIECDTDGDFKVEGAELEKLILGMGLIEELEFDENKFRKAVARREGSLPAVLTIVREMMKEEEDAETEEPESMVQIADSEAFLNRRRSDLYGYKRDGQAPPPMRTISDRGESDYSGAWDQEESEESGLF